MSMRIEAKGLTKRYGAIHAVDGLSFTVEPGRVTGFLGPNGAGKTTTMRMMLGLDAPSSGSVTIGGKPFRDHRSPMRTVGALLDARAVHPGRTVYRHLLCLAESNHLPARRVHEVLEMVGLAGVSRRRAGGLSLGMGQRLGVAAALLGDPPVLMFDEPVNGLDPEGIRWIRVLMRGYAAQGRTVLVSSHLMSEMALTADHLIVLGRGRLLADRPLDDVVSPAAGVLIRTEASRRLIPLLGAERVTVAADGALIVTGMDGTEAGAIAAAHGIALSELSPHRVSLEDAFMDLTAGSLEFTA
ncbi:ABC transporter ATP-binding protein [Catenuloplanes atrovinosus]|uniref:ABC-2 type transport system ATP-binding protein n=1 Tax=Catenuloplanes atrovinosus TaxID=137266 RepID=A0AAE4C7Z4_9ACTN|nr:ATP-binding cassette domain-containing protein [Catenuloplanes atrovinosus]MDR7274976.1 ABC-2 type transport system ATP-binding protein [Catenuloplanes atrovinosus]